MTTLVPVTCDEARFYKELTGRGIIRIERTEGTGAAGTVDTYTITYTDSTTSTYTVTNGQNGIPQGEELVALANQVLADAVLAQESATLSASAAQGFSESTSASAATAIAASDAAYVNADVYANTAAGIAAVADGEQFQVVDEGGESISRYLRSGAAALFLARYPSADPVFRTARLAGLADVVSDSYGSTSPNDTNGGASFYWTNHDPRPQPETLRSFSVRCASALTVRLLVVDAVSRLVLTDETFSALAGVNTFTPFLPVPAGARVFITPEGGQFRFVAGSGTGLTFATSSYSGTVGDQVNAPLASTNEMGMSFTFDQLSKSLKTSVDELAAEVPALQDGFARAGFDLYLADDSSVGTTEYTATTTASQNFYWSPDIDASLGSRVLTSVSINTSAAGSVRVVVVNGSNAVISDQTLTVPASGVNKLPLLAPMAVPAGARVYLRPLTAILYYLNPGSGSNNLNFAAADYSGIVGDIVTPATGNSTLLSILLHFDEPAAASLLATYGTEDRLITLTAAVNALGLSVSGVLWRNAKRIAVSGSLSFTAAGAGEARYDVAYLDMDALTFGVQAGTNRTADPSEAIPALTSARHLPVFNVRVTEASVLPVAVWDVLDGQPRQIAQSLQLERERSRLRLPKLLRKIARGDAIKVLGFGDSILAHQDIAPSSTAPNGVNRDVDFYLLENIGADIVGALPKFTSVALGRGDDGGGAIHLKASYVWDLVAAMQGVGCTVTYDNFGIGGRSTGAAVDGAFAATAWLTDAIALAPDVVVINLGMNERGNTSTEARMVAIIGHLKAADIEVIVNACPRPRTGKLSDWEFTNRALQRAARFAGAAFLPASQFDQAYIGAVGCAVQDVCTANAINHPGILEHRAIGRELVRLVIGV